MLRPARKPGVKPSRNPADTARAGSASTWRRTCGVGWLATRLRPSPMRGVPALPSAAATVPGPPHHRAARRSASCSRDRSRAALTSTTTSPSTAARQAYPGSPDSSPETSPTTAGSASSGTRAITNDRVSQARATSRCRTCASSVTDNGIEETLVAPPNDQCGREDDDGHPWSAEAEGVSLRRGAHRQIDPSPHPHAACQLHEPVPRAGYLITDIGQAASPPHDGRRDEEDGSGEQGNDAHAAERDECSSPLNMLDTGQDALLRLVGSAGEIDGGDAVPRPALEVGVSPLLADRLVVDPSADEQSRGQQGSREDEVPRRRG